MILYTLPTCGKCKVLKMKLDSKNIPYEICEDISIMRSKGILGVPAVELSDSTILTDFQKINEFVNKQ